MERIASEQKENLRAEFAQPSPCQGLREFCKQSRFQEGSGARQNAGFCHPLVFDVEFTANLEHQVTLQPVRAYDGFEQGSVRFGETHIDFAVRRCPERKTVEVAVGANGRVTLTAPLTTASERLLQIIRSKAEWIVAKRRLVGLWQRGDQREFKSGETMLYLGKNYPLQVVKGEPAPGRLRGACFEVSIPESLPENARGEYLAAALRDFLISRARRKLGDRTRYWSTWFGINLPKVELSSAQKRWCQLGPGMLCFNWRIIQAPLGLIDYVVAHELLSLVHSDQSSEFWSLLAAAVPDFELKQLHLKTVGSRFQW